MNPDTLLIATPLFDGRPDFAYHTSLLQLITHRKVINVIHLPHNSDIRYARNKLVHYFLHTPRFQSLIFIDGDVGFSESDWAALTDESKKHAVCGLYAKKQPGAEPAVGMGFARIDREVFDRLKVDTYQDDTGENYSNYFGTCVHEGKWISESRWFWNQVSAAGIDIHTFSSSTLIHYGRHGFALKTVSSPL